MVKNVHVFVLLKHHLQRSIRTHISIVSKNSSTLLYALFLFDHTQFRQLFLLRALQRGPLRVLTAHRTTHKNLGSVRRRGSQVRLVVLLQILRIVFGVYV